MTIPRRVLVALSIPMSLGLGLAVAPPDCITPDERQSPGPALIADLPDGLSSDGRGLYVRDADGVVASYVGNAAALSVFTKDTLKNARGFTVNLNNPVPNGGGVPLGVIADVRLRDGGGLMAQRLYAGDTARNLNAMRIGETVPAAQLHLAFRISGRLHILQMGPQPYGHCHGPTRINGNGTSSGTISRVSPTRWVVDLPAKSVGRLFDVPNGVENAVDKGLYYMHIHFEIGK